MGRELDNTNVYVPKGIWEWYPHSVTRDNAPKQPVIKGAGGKRVKHGTFQTYPYYAFIQTGSPGKEQLFLVSDCGLRAELRLIKNSISHKVTNNTDGTKRQIDGAKFNLLIKGFEDELDDATLSYNLEDCDDETGIVVISGVPGDFTQLPSGSHNAGKHYVPSLKREANASRNDFPIGSVFVHKINAFDLFLRSWDIRYMDLVDSNFQVTGNKARLFAQPSGNSQNYIQVGANINLPYGWVYESFAGGEVHETSNMVSTSVEVANSVQQAAGFNVSGSVGFDIGFVSAEANFSVAANSDLKTKISDVKGQEKTFIEKTVLQTDAAFVLDKRNVSLSEHFQRKVNELRRQVVRDDSLKEEVLESFFEQFGTHYAYAGVTGAKGRLVTTMTTETVAESVAEGKSAKTKWEAGAKLNVIGIFDVHASGGTDTSEGTEREKKKRTVFKKNDTYIVTYGGTSSAGGDPGADNRVPVLLDLRPISDLFGVPFYTDHTTAVLLHDQIAAAVTRFAFTPERTIQGNGLGFRRIIFDRPKLEVSKLTGAPDAVNKLYHDILSDPAAWMVRLVFPANTCMRQFGALARQLAAPGTTNTLVAPRNWVPRLLETLERLRKSQREVLQLATIELSPSGGTSVLLGPDTPRASSMALGVDVLLNDAVTPGSDNSTHPGRFYDGRILNQSDDSGMGALLAGPLDVTGPANGGPDKFEFPVLLHDLGPLGSGTLPLKYPITVWISGTIQPVTAKELLWFSGP